MSDDEKQWYTNKDLFEKLSSLKEEFNALRIDISETRRSIQDYTELRTQIQLISSENEELRSMVNAIMINSKATRTTFTDIRVWLGWVFGLVTLTVLLYNTFK